MVDSNADFSRASWGRAKIASLSIFGASFTLDGSTLQRGTHVEKAGRDLDNDPLARVALCLITWNIVNYFYVTINPTK